MFQEGDLELGVATLCSVMSPVGSFGAAFDPMPSGISGIERKIKPDIPRPSEVANPNSPHNSFSLTIFNYFINYIKAKWDRNPLRN